MKPSWVLSEDERQRRFRKNRERPQGEASTRAGPGAVLASHKREKGGPKGISSFPDMEPLDESTLASLYEQQQPQPLIVKKEQTVSPAPGEPSKLIVADQRPSLVAIPSPSFEQPQFLVKTEAGETNYIFAPVASSQQQSTILVYTAAPAESLVTSAPKEGLVAHPLRLPMSFITQASAGPSVTITAAPRSSAAENLAKVANIRTIPSAYENPASTNHQLSSSSVIVQAPQRQQVISSGYPTTNQQQNVVTKQESRNEFCPSGVRRSPPHVQALDQVTLSRLAAVASQEFESDSDYEKDVFSSDEEDDIRRQLLSNEPEVKFCEDERFQMEKLIKEHNDKYRSVNFGEELIKEMIMCSMFGIPVSTSAAISGYRLTVERITRIAHNLDCFTDLHKNDQATLLMENADLLVNLRGAIFFDSKNKGVNQILISMGIGKQALIPL